MKTTNVTTKHVMDTLLANGFAVAAGNGETPRPTARREARSSRGFAGDAGAAVSNSGKSVYLNGQHAQTKAPVQVFLQTGGRLTQGALQQIEKRTGLDFKK